MQNIRLVVIALSILVVADVSWSSYRSRSIPYLRGRLGHRFGGWDHEYDNLGRFDFDEDDYEEEDPCTVKNRLQLNEIKKELQSLTALVGGLREKVDPDFKMPTTTKPPDCPEGFEYLEQSGSCYKVIFKRFNWKSAIDQCRNLNSDSHLVSITTSQESEALNKYLAKIFSRSSARSKCGRQGWGYRETALWTSAHRVNESDCTSDFIWKTTKNEANEAVPFEFTNWQNGEPNCYQGDEFCMEVLPNHGSKWNDVACRVASCPICEYNPQ